MELEMIEHLPSGAAMRFDSAVDDLTKRPTVLLLHGWKSTVFTGSTFDELRKRLNALGINTLSLSLRGHEKARGNIEEVTRADHEKDYYQALHYLKMRPEVDSTRLGALGSSYGGYLTAFMAGIYPFKAVVLRAPALYPDIGWMKPTTRYTEDVGVRKWRNHIHAPHESTALGSLGHYKGNLLIVAGGVDDAIPTQVIDSYVQAAVLATVEREMLPEAGHVFRDADREKYIELAVRWFSSHLT